MIKFKQTVYLFSQDQELPDLKMQKTHYAAHSKTYLFGHGIRHITIL